MLILCLPSEVAGAGAWGLWTPLTALEAAVADRESTQEVLRDRWRLGACQSERGGEERSNDQRRDERLHRQRVSNSANGTVNPAGKEDGSARLN